MTIDFENWTELTVEEKHELREQLAAGLLDQLDRKFYHALDRAIEDFEHAYCVPEDEAELLVKSTLGIWSQRCSEATRAEDLREHIDDQLDAIDDRTASDPVHTRDI